MKANLAHVHWKLEVLVVLRFDADRAPRAPDGDVSRGLWQAERVGRGTESSDESLVRTASAEPNQLPHVVLVLVKAPVGFADIRAEINHRCHDEQSEKTSHRARATPAGHQLLCTPSTTCWTS